MKADLTRNTFHPAKSFRRVLMQQGRVQVDADWNEQAAILLHYLQTLAADVIGPAGAPAGNPGFALEMLDPSTSAVQDFVLSAGRFYVQGMLCEIAPTPVGWSSVSGNKNKVQVLSWVVDGLPFSKGQIVQLSNAKNVQLIAGVTDVDQASGTLTISPDLSTVAGIGSNGTMTRLVTYQSQPGLAALKQLPNGAGQPIYLDVWERAITYVEDDSIREVALNGPDTAARSKVVWQVRLLDPAAARANRNGANFDAQMNAAPRGMLKAMAKKSAAASEPCTASPDAQYRGPENQLYRVEIHTGGLAGKGATFKWSRENGSVVFPILGSSGANGVQLETLGRDDRFGLSEGDWVEAEDDSTALLGTQGALLQVQSIDRTAMTVTLSGPVLLPLTPGSHALLRRWDQKQGDAAAGGLDLGQDMAALIVEDSTNWQSLENGIQIQFQKGGAGPKGYRAGDYWLIPARTATGDVEWPRETDANGVTTAANAPLAMPPDGVEHFYALLGTIDVAAGAVTGVTSTRMVFDPISK